MVSTGERIKNIRIEHGYTLKDFGIEIGKRLDSDRVKESIISRWENNISLPNNERLKVIAELGGMPVKDLVSTHSVGERIKRIREELGISMSDFALLIDDKAKSGTVANWETGKNLPNRKRLNKIAELGNITVNQLLNSNPLSDYSTDELLQELERRGISHETTDK